MRSFFRKREVPYLKTILEILTAALFVVLVIIVFINSFNIVNKNLQIMYIVENNYFKNHVN